MTLTYLARGIVYPRTRRPVSIGDESEKHFLGRVTRLAELYGWVVHHTLDSTGTRAGEPDLRMIRPPRYLLAELKSQHGRLRPEQVAMLAMLERCPGVESFVWRPSDWQQIVEVLR
jgi:hypothetical protein